MFAWYLIGQPIICVSHQSARWLNQLPCPAIGFCSSDAQIAEVGTCHQLAAMPTRSQKADAHSLWRVAASRGRIAKLLKMFPWEGRQFRELKGGTIVEVEKTGQFNILLRWTPPRKYDTVKTNSDILEESL